MTINERLAERRTPDAYGRSTTMSAYNTEKIGDYEDIYAAYNDKYVKSPSTSVSKDTVSLSSHKSPQDQTPTHVSHIILKYFSNMISTPPSCYGLHFCSKWDCNI